MRREKFLHNYLYYKNIIRCQRGASPHGLAGRVNHRARASPHLVSLCILNRHRRKKWQRGQGLTTRQDRAANSWELLPTHYCLPWACQKSEGRQKPGALYCPENTTMWLSPSFFLLLPITIYHCKKQWWIIFLRKHVRGLHLLHLPQLTLVQECLSPFLPLRLSSAIKLSFCSSAILEKDAKSSRKQKQRGKENHSTALPLQNNTQETA